MSQSFFVEHSLARLFHRTFRGEAFIKPENALSTFNTNTLNVNANLREAGLIQSDVDEHERALSVGMSLSNNMEAYQNFLNWFQELVTGSYKQYINETDKTRVGSRGGFEAWFAKLDKCKQEIFVPAVSFVRSLKTVLDRFSAPGKDNLDQVLETTLCDASAKVKDLLNWSFRQ